MRCEHSGSTLSGARLGSSAFLHAIQEEVNDGHRAGHLAITSRLLLDSSSHSSVKAVEIFLSPSRGSQALLEMEPDVLGQLMAKTAAKLLF
jgi:hypothetical protein